MSPLLFEVGVGGRNVFCPPYFRGRNSYYVVDLLNNDCFSCPLNIIIHSRTHLICLAAGLRSDPLERDLSALARPQLLATENGV